MDNSTSLEWIKIVGKKYIISISYTETGANQGWAVAILPASNFGLVTGSGVGRTLGEACNNADANMLDRIEKGIVPR